MSILCRIFRFDTDFILVYFVKELSAGAASVLPVNLITRPINFLARRLTPTNLSSTSESS